MKTRSAIRRRFPVPAFLCAIGMITSSLIITFAAPPGDEEKEKKEKEEHAKQPGGKKDDWALQLNSLTADGFAPTGARFGTVPLSAGMPAPSAAAPMAKMATGFAVGGSKDIGNFRENIEQGFLPLPEAVTVEGLYYDYYFDTGAGTAPSEKLFSPLYSLAQSPDPLSAKKEYYMAVGLAAGAEAAAFKRKKLNLVVVLDISGSMSSPFDEYYYDRGNRRKVEDGDRRTKMHIAREAVQDLTRQLRDDDRFGMVVFDDLGYLAKPLNLVGETDMDKIRGHIGELEPRGGTNFEAGYKKGAELFGALQAVDPAKYENRVIFLTDAMPNTGQIEEDGLFGMTERNARRRLYSTFVGVGVDFNAALIETITKVRGANYFTVNSSKSFKKLLADDFEYMVTPMVFDLSLQLQAEGVSIEKVFGSPEANLATGQLMRVNTLFPSRASEEGIRGGLVLLKLSGDPRGGKMTLKASYEKRDGTREGDQQQIQWPPAADAPASAAFPNSGIRKGILLARYASLLANWTREERSHAASREKPPTTSGVDAPAQVRYFCALSEMPQRGICLPPVIAPALGKWEQTSLPLTVRPESRRTIETFLAHFETEAKALGDVSLAREEALLKKLIAASKKSAPGEREIKPIAPAAAETPGAAAKKDDWKLPAVRAK